MKRLSGYGMPLKRDLDTKDIKLPLRVRADRTIVESF
jgi:hypothetical protein